MEREPTPARRMRLPPEASAARIECELEAAREILRSLEDGGAGEAACSALGGAVHRIGKLLWARHAGLLALLAEEVEDLAAAPAPAGEAHRREVRRRLALGVEQLAGGGLPGTPEAAVLLAVNEWRARRGARLVTEARLFTADLPRTAADAGEAERGEPSTIAGFARRIRPRFQEALASWLREQARHGAPASRPDTPAAARGRSAAAASPSGHSPHPALPDTAHGAAQRGARAPSGATAPVPIPAPPVAGDPRATPRSALRHRFDTTPDAPPPAAAGGPSAAPAPASGPRDDPVPEAASRPSAVPCPDGPRPAPLAVPSGADAGLAPMVAVLDGVAGACAGWPGGVLWRLAHACCRGMAGGTIPAGAVGRRLLGRIDRELRRLGEAPDRCLGAVPSPSLLANLLFYLEQGAPGDARSAALRARFGTRQRFRIADLPDSRRAAFLEHLGAELAELAARRASAPAEAAERAALAEALEAAADSLGLLGEAGTRRRLVELAARLGGGADAPAAVAEVVEHLRALALAPAGNTSPQDEEGCDEVRAAPARHPPPPLRRGPGEHREPSGTALRHPASPPRVPPREEPMHSDGSPSPLARSPEEDGDLPSRLREELARLRTLLERLESAPPSGSGQAGPPSALADLPAERPAQTPAEDSTSLLARASLPPSASTLPLPETEHPSLLSAPSSHGGAPAGGPHDALATAAGEGAGSDDASGTSGAKQAADPGTTTARGPAADAERIPSLPPAAASIDRRGQVGPELGDAHPGTLDAASGEGSEAADPGAAAARGPAADAERIPSLPPAAASIDRRGQVGPELGDARPGTLDAASGEGSEAANPGAAAATGTAGEMQRAGSLHAIAASIAHRRERAEQDHHALRQEIESMGERLADLRSELRRLEIVAGVPAGPAQRPSSATGSRPGPSSGGRDALLARLSTGVETLARTQGRVSGLADRIGSRLSRQGREQRDLEDALARTLPHAAGEARHEVLMVEVCGKRMGFLLSEIEAVARLTPAQRRTLEDDEVSIEHAQRPYRVRYLGALLGLAPETPWPDSRDLVLVAVGQRRLALLVDAILGRRRYALARSDRLVAGLSQRHGTDPRGGRAPVPIIVPDELPERRGAQEDRLPDLS